MPLGYAEVKAGGGSSVGVSVGVEVSEDFSTPSSLQSGQELRPVVSHCKQC